MYGSRARGCGEWIRWKNRRGGRVFRYHLGWCVLVYRIVLLFTCLGLSKDNVVHNKVLLQDYDLITWWDPLLVKVQLPLLQWHRYMMSPNDQPTKRPNRLSPVGTDTKPINRPTYVVSKWCITFVRPEVIAVDLNLHLNLGIKPIWTLSHVHVLEYEKMIEFLRDILENNSSYYNATLVERAARFWYRSASCPGLGNDIDVDLVMIYSSRKQVDTRPSLALNFISKSFLISHKPRYLSLGLTQYTTRSTSRNTSLENWPRVAMTSPAHLT